MTEAARRENPAADRIAALFHAHHRDVFAYAARRVPAEAANDVVAEAFLIAWSKLEQVPADALPWLLAVARNLIRNQVRASGRRRVLHSRLAGDAANEARAHDGDERDDDLRAAFDQLSERDRELLALIAWEGLAPSQAARVLGRTPTAVRVQLHRAKRRLMRALERRSAHHYLLEQLPKES